MMITYRNLDDTHYVKVNGEVNCHNSNLLWSELNSRGIIPDKKISYDRGLIELINGFWKKYFERKKEVDNSKRVVLDFSETDLQCVSGVAICS